MSKKLCIISLILLSFLLIPSAAALIGNNTMNQVHDLGDIELASASYIHDDNYTRFEIEVLLIAIGLFCLAVSRLSERSEDIFSIGAVVPLGLAAWYANFMTFEYMVFPEVLLNITAVKSGYGVPPFPFWAHAEVITPHAGLSIVCVVLFMLSVINVIWIFFLQRDRNNVSKGGV